MNQSGSQTPRVQFITITANQAGQRIDNFLITIEKGVPKSRIYRALRKGEVRVNKGRIKQTYKLQHGDEVRIPPLRVSEQKPAAQVNEKLRQELLNSIIFEDEHLLVLNKPAGLAVHAGSGIHTGIIEAFRLLRPELEFLELVHRLDRDTSGCLLIAKSRDCLLNLQQQMLDDIMDKHYLTLVKGHWANHDTIVEQPLLKNSLDGGERMVRIDPAGKYAKTQFVVHRRLNCADLTEAILFTGRTHQIRVHASFSGHPLAGDEKYGDRQFNKQLKAQGLKRMFLHAWKLRIRHPHSHEALELIAPLPAELEALCQQLETSK